MNYISWMRSKSKRLYSIFLAIIFCVVLFVMNVRHTFLHYAATPPPPVWLSLGFSTLTALMFLLVGSLVWLYARNRPVALVLLGLSVSMMTIFLVETSSSIGDLVLSRYSAIGSLLAVPFLALLLLLFPKNYFTSHSSSRETVGSRRLFPSVVLLRIYTIVLFLVCGILALAYALYYFLQYTIPSWLDLFSNMYTAIGLTGALITIVISYSQSSLRERQQLRLFVGGVILTIVPFLLLTLLPQLLLLPQQYSVDPEFSTLTIVVFPLSLGYSILRYQILIFDTYIRRVVSWLVGAIFLLGLSYITVWVCSTVLVARPSFYVIFVSMLTAILAPCTWWLAKVGTEYLFSSEIRYHRDLLEKPTLLVDATLDLREAAQVLTLASVQTFETPEVCLFVLEEESGSYCICPALEQIPADEARRNLASHIGRMLSSTEESPTDESTIMEMPHSAIVAIARSQRPLLLSEVIRSKDQIPVGLSRYLSTASLSDEVDALIAPVRAQGKMIGVLVLGKRGDQQYYAGPDFDVVQLLLDRFSPILETARLYDRAQRHAALLNSLYSASTIPGNSYQTVEDIVTTYTMVAAEAVAASAEVWLYDDSQHVLHFASAVGETSPIDRSQLLYPSQKEDWLPWFYEGEGRSTEHMPSVGGPLCLSQVPELPFAWLPLVMGKQHLGVLMLFYPRPHLFTKEEVHVLELFANQCAAALENTRITIALRAAYERQKELDVLKDQFIMTASHELRTPLTAVQGYIELLEQYNQTLSAEVRANFINNARRGCDELSLMVGNIMDAGHIHVDAENMQFQAVSLRESVIHVIEIMESIIKGENRVAIVDIDPAIVVLADDQRLRQVLLNLIANALKYSPSETNIEIIGQVREHIVTVGVRDYGMGVLPEDQEHLFERFVRLERDMNSPVRGVGLGLSICKQLIEAMGGNIWVESSGEAGKGSLFTFTLREASEPSVVSYPETPSAHFSLS